jgi:hypothetical protein
MTGQLTYDANRARVDDLHRRARRHRMARGATRSATPAAEQRRGRLAESVTIRRSTAADRLALARLAALDSAPAPTGDMLMAEIDGEAVAAIELAGGVTIADPFRPTAELVELLGLRAAGLHGAPTRRRLRLRLRLRLRPAYRVA